MEVDKVYNFTLFSANEYDNGGKGEQPKYLAPFITVTSILSLILFCFVVEVVIAKSVKLFSRSEKTKSSEKISNIKNVSILTIIKHGIQCKLDMQHTARSLLNTYGLAWKVSLFGNDYVCLHDPAMLQKLYMSWEPGHLNKPNWFYSKVLVGPLTTGLTSSKVNVWKPHRTAVCKGFSYNSLKNQVKLFNDYGKKLINRLNEEPFYSKLNLSSDFHTGSLSRIVHETAFDIISHIASGKPGLLNAEESNMFHETFMKLKNLISYRIYRPWLIPDPLWLMHPKGREMTKSLKFLDDMLYKNLKIAKEENMRNADINRNSEYGALSLLDEMTKGGLSDDEMFMEIFTFLASGHETVSMTLNLTLFHLAANVEYQKNCQEEVDQLFSEMMSTNQQEISMDAINSLEYLDRCIKEELRLYPTTPLIGRQLYSPIELDENTRLKSGTVTLTSLWLLHRNKDHFPNPEKFDPDRFLPENSTERKLCEYMPFGMGARNCIGGKSGTLEVKVLVAYMLYNFELSTDVTVEEAREAFEKCIWPPPELHMRLTRRR